MKRNNRSYTAMGWIDRLRKLGVFRSGSVHGTYKNAKERPTELMMDDVYDAKKDLLKSSAKKSSLPKDDEKIHRIVSWVLIGLGVILAISALANNFFYLIIAAGLWWAIYYFGMQWMTIGKFSWKIILVVSICAWVVLIVVFSDTRSNDSGQNNSNNGSSSVTNSEQTTNSDSSSQSFESNQAETAFLPYPSRNSSACSVVSQSQVPTNWPSDITLYPGARITSVKCAPNDADLYEVRVVTDDDVAAVTNYFESTVQNDQWGETTITDNDLYDTFTAYKLLNTYKHHQNSERQLILDIRSYKDSSRVSGNTEIIYREREWNR